MEFNTFEESFKYYSWMKAGSDYRYKNGATNMFHTLMDEDLVTDINIEKIETNFEGIKCERQSLIAVAKEEAIARFHPNFIDNKKFWELSKKVFSLVSVCGSPCSNYIEANKLTLQMSKQMGTFSKLESVINPDSNVLEIGFGYGGVFKEIKDKCNYVGIDYTKPKFLKKYNNLYAIDKSGIPDHLYKPEFYDVVYSVNVLQHCSQHDRFEYFTQGYNVLKQGGCFIFSCNVMTQQNENSRAWGIKDKQGRGYTIFFNQLTEVDSWSELNNLFYKLGFGIEKAIISNVNLLSCTLIKL